MAKNRPISINFFGRTCEVLQMKPNGTQCRKDKGVFDRKALIAAAAEFLQKQNVTHYFTLTYPQRRSWESRYKAFVEWVDALEWIQGTAIGWFRADEMRRFSGLGFPEIPMHHHGLLIGTSGVSCRTAENLWRTFGDARVERYIMNGGGAEYCLKHAFEDCGDWDIGGKALKPSKTPMVD